MTIKGGEQEPSHADELHAVLFKFLMNTGVPASWLKEASLQELVTKTLEYKIAAISHSHFDAIRSLLQRFFGKV